MNSQKEILSYVRNLSEAFLADHYPEELPYLPLLWEQLFAENREFTAESIFRSARTRSGQIGLAFDKGGSVLLVAPFAIMVVFCTLLGLESETISLDEEKVAAAIRESARALGASSGLTQMLSSSLAPAIVQWSSQLPGKVTSITPEPGGTDTLFVSRLLAGKLSMAKDYSTRYAKSMPSRELYDIVIDEPAHLIRIQTIKGVEDNEIVRVMQMRRGMLWLVLHNVGDYVRHEDIATMFSFDNVTDISRVYQYRAQLGKLLGDELRDRVLVEGAGKRYKVPREGWSFCWILRNEDLLSSELLDGLRPISLHK